MQDVLVLNNLIPVHSMQAGIFIKQKHRSETLFMQEGIRK